MMLNKNFRAWDLPAAVCLTLIVFLSSYALERTYWTYDLNRVTSLAIFGLLAGYFIGRSSFSVFFARILMGFYSTAFFVLQFIIPLNSNPDWLFRVHQYLERVNLTFSQLSQNIPLEDGILFLTGAGILFLFSSMTVGFRLMRSTNVWIPFALICGFFYLTQFYLPEFHRNYFSIAVFTILVVFFIGRVTFSKRQLAWQEGGIKNDPSISGYFSRSVLLITIILGFVSWGIPASVKYINEQTQAAERILRQRNSDSWQVLRNFFYPLRQQTGFSEGYFPEILSLGNTRNLKDDEVFQVDVEEPETVSSRYYWKGRIYDTYENGTWKNTGTELSDTSSFDLSKQPLPDLKPFVFSVHYRYPREVVFSPQYVLDIDREANLLVNSAGDQQSEIVSIVDYSLVRTGDTVRILGGFNSATLPILKKADADYPAWVTEKYLQLPEDLPLEIQQLADDLTKNRKTQIDKAQAIIDYLRTSYRYKNSVDIPQGEDPVAWFLFSGREGFCNYYSTSAALLMRAAGIPARMVVGYAQGERIDGSDGFRVRIADSHSWVEVYFKGIGWLTMEPTPSQPSVLFPSEEKPEEKIGRVEALLLQPPKGGGDTEKKKEYFQLIEKYATEIEDAIIEDQSPRRILMIFLTLLGVSLVIAGMLYLALFQQKSIQTPLIIEKAYRGKNKAPAWIKRWAEFEKLNPDEKNYIRLRELSKLVIKRDPRVLTPKEFFAELFEKIHYESPNEFSNTYQQILFSAKENHDIHLDPLEYTMIVREIFRSWLKGLIKYLKFRLDLGRFGNISS